MNLNYEIYWLNIYQIKIKTSISFQVKILDTESQTDLNSILNPPKGHWWYVTWWMLQYKIKGFIWYKLSKYEP